MNEIERAKEIGQAGKDAADAELMKPQEFIVSNAGGGRVTQLTREEGMIFTRWLKKHRMRRLEKLLMPLLPVGTWDPNKIASYPGLEDFKSELMTRWLERDFLGNRWRQLKDDEVRIATVLGMNIARIVMANGQLSRVYYVEESTIAKGRMP